MLVVDASAVVELLLARPAAAAVERIATEHGFELHAPQLIDVEVVSALRRLVARGSATAVRAGEAVDDLLDLPLERYAHQHLVPRVWELRDNFSAYDAAYVALAEAVIERGAPLLTADARPARAVEAFGGVRVHLVG
jgi:predicted nucleic acid-binding protein